MNFPQAVADLLEQYYVGRSRPFCFSVDHEFRLLQTWGDGRWCGFESYVSGDPMAEREPFLAACDPGSAEQLDFLSIKDGVTVHLLTRPFADGLYAVLLDARPDHDVLQGKQQSVNEHRLLKLRQDSLIRRQNSLIAELVEAKAELDHLHIEAQRSSAARGQFIAMMSHEFRTPLASIISYADMALEDNVPDNQVRKSLESISRSGQHLSSLVEAVLDDASLRAGTVQLNKRDFSPRDIAADLSAIMAPLAAEKGLAFSASTEANMPELLHADDVCLRQVLVNMLGNAVKFTEEGSIRLHLAWADETLLATVTDTGPGIDEADQQRVFRAFERGEGQNASGTGLGLTISLQLARLMDGDLSMTTAPGSGCRIELRVPVAVAEPGGDVDSGAFPAPSADNMATRAASVLVCDDDEDMLALIEFYLHRAGYGLIASGNGIEAIEKTVAYQPDLVLMDVNVPDTNGVDAAREMRRQGFRNPIVALTASRLSAREAAEFTLCFRKPAPMQDLLAQIKRLTHASPAPRMVD